MHILRILFLLHRKWLFQFELKGNPKQLLHNRAAGRAKEFIGSSKNTDSLNALDYLDRGVSQHPWKVTLRGNLEGNRIRGKADGIFS